jgi:hypothetical protein
LVFNGEVENPHAIAIWLDTVTILVENVTLEVLAINNTRDISPDNYFNALESLHTCTNTTLKTLRLHPKLDSVVEDGKIKHLISLVKKNFGLGNLDELFPAHDKTGEIGTILRLNQAGRHYLIEDAPSIAQGVEVLVAVRKNLGCLFYHLLENPLLCDLEHRYVAIGTITDGPVHSNKRPRTSK